MGVFLCLVDAPHGEKSWLPTSSRSILPQTDRGEEVIWYNNPLPHC